MNNIEGGLSQSEISNYFILAERLGATDVIVYEGESNDLSCFSFDDLLNSEEDDFTGMTLKY